MFTVYLLYSKQLNRYYIGFTSNLDVRLTFHKNSASRKFTSKASDWCVYLTISCSSKSQGLAIEQHLKKMKSRIYLENLSKYPEIIEKLKGRYLWQTVNQTPKAFGAGSSTLLVPIAIGKREQKVLQKCKTFLFYRCSQFTFFIRNNLIVITLGSLPIWMFG
jgi:putative endonuclease